ncbi:hypothetical protein ID866_3280 [Astraeus odoratus]|nr:hypothetical protein ID866_3280 [Astraeus odoratus]
MPRESIVTSSEGANLTSYPGLSLAQQIAELEDVAPAGKCSLEPSPSRHTLTRSSDFDPEDAEVRGVDPDEDEVVEDSTAARAHYVAVGPSALRKAYHSITDPKYEGVKMSRKDLMEEQSDLGDSEGGEDDGEEEEDEGEEGDDFRSQLEDEGNEADEYDTRGHGRYDHEPPSSEEGYSSEHEAGSTTDGDSIKKPGPSLSESQDNDLSSSLRRTREEDRRKGKAVAKQIALWDSLLDARIRLQKSVVAGNRLPPLSQYGASGEVQGALVRMLEQAQLLSDELYSFQEARVTSLLSSNEGIELPPRKRRRSDWEPSIPNYAGEFREASSDLSSLQLSYHPHLIQTLNKWSTKIQAVAPSVLLPSNRNAFSKSMQNLKSAAQLIDETLADHDKVLSRTRLYRGKSERLGVELVEEADKRMADPTVFDDTDFYQQLLRDIIDSRNGPGGGDDWLAVQKEKKEKKRVDTKASKGRKLRYHVHEKLMNFMVPIPAHNSWHEEQIDELFASLLGKGFENAMQEVGEVVDDDMDTSLQKQVDAALVGGFRVFG